MSIQNDTDMVSPNLKLLSKPLFIEYRSFNFKLATTSTVQHDTHKVAHD